MIGGFELSIDLGNAAMQTPGDVVEALIQVTARIGMGETEGRIKDRNGNSVGEWVFDTEEGDEDDDDEGLPVDR